MITIRPGSHVLTLLSILPFVGEYPMSALRLLGSVRSYKDLIHKLTQVQDLDFYRDKLISKCKLFTTEDLGLAKAAGIFTEDRTIPAMLRYFEELGSSDAFRRMCILDALTFNPDRHYGNFGVLFNTETMEPISMCPVFDNNRSLFPDLDQGQLENPDWYIEKCKPMIGKDFLVTARGLLTPEIRSDLKNLQGFQFDQHTRIEAPQERLEALSAIVNTQINAILQA